VLCINFESMILFWVTPREREREQPSVVVEAELDGGEVGDTVSHRRGGDRGRACWCRGARAADEVKDGGAACSSPRFSTFENGSTRVLWGHYSTTIVILGARRASSLFIVVLYEEGPQP
jgi:hypothetical protein